MRFGTLFGGFLSLAALTLSVTAAEKAGAPAVVATTTFKGDNANHIVNGKKNTFIVTVENKSNKPVTLVGISGALVHPDTNVLVKNLTSQKYGVPLLEKVKLPIPYTFYSEFKPGDHRLNIWVEHSTEDGSYKAEAYDSIITVVDPDLSILDFKLLSSFAMVAAFFGGIGYLVYTTLFPQAKKPKAKKTTTDAVSSPVGAVTATGSGGYQEEWIPEHHLRKNKAGKKGALSGDELSGAETSGAEGKRRKAKK